MKLQTSLNSKLRPTAGNRHRASILLGLNEINFSFIESYCRQGRLPTFHQLFTTFGYAQTTSEASYELLEPWIQWVTVHTGLPYSQHRVFRLGDIVDNTHLKQLWEYAEEAGLTTAAVSPFNAHNSLRNPDFFVPDPWTKASFSGPPTLEKIYEAIVKAVNDNAHGGLARKELLALLKGLITYVPPSRYGHYLSLAARWKRKATKANILDSLLADVFLTLFKKKRPGFSSLFLNAGAHEQHHYMFNSGVYEGPLKNPSWYINENDDPLLDILESYDAILSQLLKLNVRLFIATGLHQNPHEHETFYYRLKNHQAFFDYFEVIGISKIIPRMSRDFLIECASVRDAQHVHQTLSGFVLKNTPLFTIDNRGDSLFVEMTYDAQIMDNDAVEFNGKKKLLKEDTAFVAIKNGEHDGIGYFIDTGSPKVQSGTKLPLTDVFHIIKNSFTQV